MTHQGGQGNEQGSGTENQVIIRARYQVGVLARSRGPNQPHDQVTIHQEAQWQERGSKGGQELREPWEYLEGLEQRNKEQTRPT